VTEPESSARSYSFRGRVVRAGESPASSGNLANIITVVRILLAPLFVVLLVLDGGADGPLRVAAAVLFIVAIATDGVDGMLARRRNLVTDLGILLDPIADKLLATLRAGLFYRRPGRRSCLSRHDQGRGGAALGRSRADIVHRI